MNLGDKDFLTKLSRYQMHVHAIEEGEQLPFHITNLDTHYIMQGSEIIFHGNLMMLVAFVSRYHTENDPKH